MIAPKLPRGIAEVEHALWAVHSGQCTLKIPEDRMAEYRAIVDALECLPGILAKVRREALEKAAALVREFVEGERDEQVATTLEQAAEHIEMFAEHGGGS